MSASILSSSKQKSVLYLASSLCDGLEDNDIKQLTTLLTSKDADPNVLMPLHGITPFHLVIGNESETFAEEVTKLFLRHGGNPNVKSVDGMTPVHVAAAWGRTNILELLLSNGGDPLSLDTDYCSPIQYALQGNHFEAVRLLTNYCINDEDDNDTPKFKRELDRVLVNNGEVLAEYIVSDDSVFESSDKFFNLSNNNIKEDSQGSINGYDPQIGSTDDVSINSEYVTVRKTRKGLTEQNFDFKRETMEEEKQLINRIIARLSSSLASDADTTSTSFQNHTEEYSSNVMSPPRRKEITMTFNRPKTNNEYCKSTTSQSTNRRRSTLQVIKQHNNLSQLKNSRVLAKSLEKNPISEKNIMDKNKSFQSPKSKTPSMSTSLESVPETLSQLNKWLDETIISKSPNLLISNCSNGKKRNFVKTPIFEKRSSPLCKDFNEKSSSNSPKTNVNQSPKYKTCTTPLSRIPRPKKYLTTPSHMKSTKRRIETPTATVIPNKRKADSSKKAFTAEKSKCTTALNRTYSKSGTSTPTSGSQSLSSQGDKRKIKKVAMNLDNCMYDNEENFAKEKSITIREGEAVKNNRYISTFEKEFAKIFPSELASGVEILDSGVTSKSNSKSESDDNRTDLKPACDLNRTFRETTSQVGTKEDKYFQENENENSKDCDNSLNFFNSLMCTRGSNSSNSSDSFQSLSVANDHINDINSKTKNIEYKDDIKEEPFSEQNPTSPNDSLASSRKLESETFVSVDEEYKYEDPEEGIVFLERRLCVTPSCPSSDMNSSYYSCSTARSEPLPRELLLLDHIILRERLKSLGENPGPITESTHRVYLKRLHKLESQGQKYTSSNSDSAHVMNVDQERNLLKSSLLSIEWIKDLDDYEANEQKIFKEFDNPNPSRKWREGTSKSSFNYLLLDPRITNDLPRRAGKLSMSEKWKTFLSAIFYVGKGKKSRPYAHLYDAFKIWVSKHPRTVTNQKIQRILDIWNEDRGVVVLHVFHNTIPVEAYTREATMIEALGTQKLGNCKNGDYYGVVATWRSKEKCELGRYLLFKALQILLIEGERQIFPDNL